jgi:hypothetical protein
MRRSVSFFAVLLIITGFFAPIAARMYRAREDAVTPVMTAAPSGADERRFPFTVLATQATSSTIRHRFSSTQGDLAIAAIDAVSGAGASLELPMPAAVGEASAPFESSEMMGKAKNSQSDAESFDPLAVTIRPVAPVSIHEEGLAAVSVSLATVRSSATSPGVLSDKRSGWTGLARNKSKLPLAVFVMNEYRPAATTAANLANQRQVVRSPEIVAVPCATLIDSAAHVIVGIGSGWPVLDESPVCDPSALLEQLPVDDPLRSVVERWLPSSSASESRRAIISSQDLDRRIGQSSLPFRTLYEMGRISALLDEKSRQKDFWRAALFAKARESDQVKRSAPNLLSLEVLTGNALWNWHDDTLAGGALAILLKCEKPATLRFVQATVLYADLLDRLSDSREQEMIEPLRKLVLQIPELSARDRFEMRWLLSRALIKQHRYLEGLTELTRGLRNATGSSF